MARNAICTAFAVGLLVLATGAAAQEAAPADADYEVIRRSAVQFVEAYNARNVDKLAELFAEDAEVLLRDEHSLHGRAEIREAFVAAFQQQPDRKISLAVDALRFITPDVAIEDGATVSFTNGDTPTTRSRYSVVHVKRDGHWRMKLVREQEEQPLTAYAHLRALEWLVGDWVDEGADGVIISSFHWNDSRTFLLRDFEVKRNGDLVMQGQQRIGWDPITRQIRSWVFEEAGGFGEAIWMPIEHSWVVKSTGVHADGQTATSTQTLTPLGEDRVEWRVEGRTVGQTALPDITVIMVRPPPAPSTAAAK